MESYNFITVIPYYQSYNLDKEEKIDYLIEFTK